MAQTHEVFNQFGELADYDLLATDPALREALVRADAGWAAPRPLTAGAGAWTRCSSTPAGTR